MTEPGTDVTRSARPAILDIKSFGGTAAEDDDVQKFFVRTPAFETVWSGERHVVVGRKGSGKTALYLAILDEASEQGRLAAGLTFKQYPWQAHYRYASTDVDSTERFVASWTFLILAETFSRLARTEGIRGAAADAVGEVRQFIEKAYGSAEFNYKKAFPQGGLRLHGASFAPSVLGNSLGGLDVQRAGGGFGDSLQRLNEWLGERLRRAGADIPATYVLFDELDLGYDPNEPLYVDRITGLLLAARWFVIDFTRKGVPVHPVVFLRADIFDSLSFGDKNKIVSSEVLELSWHDRLDYHDASLKHLIDWRIKEVLGETDIQGAWNKVFDPKLTRGTQHKFQHITFRTFLRPRDVISFCNSALAQAKRRLSVDLGGGDRISNQDLKECRAEYSRYLLRELDDEIGEAIPGWQKYLEPLKSIGAAKFGRSDFDKGYAAATAKIHLDLTSDEILALLYRYSILGFERKAKGGSGLEHHFRYQDETILFEPQARSFQVHRGLKEVLGISETLGGED